MAINSKRRDYKLQRSKATLRDDAANIQKLIKNLSDGQIKTIGQIVVTDNQGMSLGIFLISKN